jgi:hypothetical protein
MILITFLPGEAGKSALHAPLPSFEQLLNGALPSETLSLFLASLSNPKPNRLAIAVTGTDFVVPVLFFAAFGVLTKAIGTLKTVLCFGTSLMVVFLPCNGFESDLIVIAFRAAPCKTRNIRIFS